MATGRSGRSLALPMVGLVWAAVLTTAALPDNPPAFAWDTLPVFIHTQNESGPLNDTAARFMASFPLVTIEKNQDGRRSPCCSEDKTLAAARAVKAHNASARVLYYQNTIINFPQYRLAGRVPDSALLHYKNGTLFTLRDCSWRPPPYPVFDHRQNATRELWLGALRYVLTEGAGTIDGLFADRGRAEAEVDMHCLDLTPAEQQAWDAGHTALMEAAMALVAELVRDGKGIVIPNGRDVDGVNGRMFENFRPGTDAHAVPPISDLEALTREAGEGRIAEVHSDSCSHNSAAFNSSLTAFLIGAVEHSYYACTKSWTLQSGGDQWYPEYSRPLGKPLGPYTKVGGVMTRKFASGTQAWLDEAWAHPCVAWADGTTTGAQADCRTYGRATARVSL